jgi:hypothetical protein
MRRLLFSAEYLGDDRRMIRTKSLNTLPSFHGHCMDRVHAQYAQRYIVKNRCKESRSSFGVQTPSSIVILIMTYPLGHVDHPLFRYRATTDIEGDDYAGQCETRTGIAGSPVAIGELKLRIEFETITRSVRIRVACGQLGAWLCILAAGSDASIGSTRHTRGRPRKYFSANVCGRSPALALSVRYFQ